MNKKKFIRNWICIIVLGYLFYYFNGFYLSREACVEDSMRGLYADTLEEVWVFERGNYSETLMVNFEKMTYSFAGAKKIGPFYRIDSGSSNIKLHMNNPFELTYSGGDIGVCFVVYRVDKNIDYIIGHLQSGEVIVFDNWVEDFCGQLIISDRSFNGVYYAYDANDNLIAERSY